MPSAEPGGGRFEVLVTLIEAYERTHFPVSPADSIDAIKSAESLIGA